MARPSRLGPDCAFTLRCVKSWRRAPLFAGHWRGSASPAKPLNHPAGRAALPVRGLTMPTNRRRFDRTRRHITPEAVDAWMRADYMTLHIVLDLHPWETSPLPIEITPLGVSEDLIDSDDSRYQGDLKALKLQRELLTIAGWPDCRKIYEEELRDAEQRVTYCRKRVENFPGGEYGTGTSPAE